MTGREVVRRGGAGRNGGRGNHNQDTLCEEKKSIFNKRTKNYKKKSRQNKKRMRGPPKRDEKSPPRSQVSVITQPWESQCKQLSSEGLCSAKLQETSVRPLRPMSSGL